VFFYFKFLNILFIGLYGFLSFFFFNRKESVLIFTIFCVVLPGRDKRPIKSLVVGRPILLALEDIDGGPSFLEKALQFLEKYGKL